MPHRLLNLPELGLLIYLLRQVPNADRFLAVLPTIAVEDTNEGSPGNLRFVGSKSGRQLGSTLAETRFSDEDGVTVLARLYLDQHGNLYELDCWKVDDSPVKRIPAF
ncbi:DUF6984 family protein [Hymenobacter koreensis]|uniref:DUF6984 domain-containing protein n=1 Tax=Hymenobacter koreensis TaxID=1084523 RepID=A0ABP8J6C8_9BACT